MDVQQLLTELSAPSAYSAGVTNVEIRQTHISIVCVTDSVVYKIRKSVKFPFLDFSTVTLRRADCEREVRLNERLAPEVYLGVVPILVRENRLLVADSENGHGDGDLGEIVDWAVKMRRLPDDATLESRLARGDVNSELIRRLGRRLADFHAFSVSGPEVSKFARHSIVAHNIRDNLDFARKCETSILSTSVLQRLYAQTENRLAAFRSLIERRAEAGIARDTHGDLRLEHVYLFPDRKPPNDLCVIDCVEFNDELRYADPVADIAFVVMDLKFHGRADLADELIDEYFRASGDAEGKQLLPLYTSYRAAVRAKVSAMEMAELEISEERREKAARRSRAFWLLALSEIENPSDRPCLVLVGGLQGTGKTTLARGLANIGRFAVIRTDVVRKELARHAGLSLDHSHSADIYTSEWTTRTYAECLDRAIELVQNGQRVIIDGTFSWEEQRHRFLRAAQELGLPMLSLCCQADAGIIHQRLDARVGDESDADWQVYLNAVKKWEATSPSTSRVTVAIDCSGAPDLALANATVALEKAGLFMAVT